LTSTGPAGQGDQIEEKLICIGGFELGATIYFVAINNN